MADLTITAANVNKGTGARVREIPAGATITPGQAVYENSADGFAGALADADVSASARCAGIALTGGYDNGTMLIQYDGTIDGMGATEGVVYVVSATAGGVAPVADLTTGDYVTVLGVGNSNGGIDMTLFVSGAQVQ